MAAAVTTQEASSSISRCPYHVFLSFRGEDTRTNFTSHLYDALKRAGIHTFLDDDGIERGENIKAELDKAIIESKISIIVFSSDYASSRWCLDELVMIMKQRKAVGLIVLPVFYKVDPSQVRKQTESFAAAFVRHEMRFTEEMDKVKSWRDALREVADLAGMPLNNRHEAQFIQDIVREIQEKLKKLKRPGLIVAPHLVGIDSRVKHINRWLQDGSSVVDIVTIFGIGGIGKTTIAKTVYNQNIDKFQGTSFLENVKDTLKEVNGLVGLLNQLLSNLQNWKTNDVKSVDEGIIMIKDAICCKKVLIVLDDVDQLDQLDAVIRMREWLYPGSKIIITTRCARLLRGHKVNFEIKVLDDEESLELLSWHAFGQDHPIEGYRECSQKVVDQCGGLPLALKVLGESLFDKSIDEWESALQKLEAYPDCGFQDKLEISYDSLKDEHDKNLFLDIACFFIGEDENYTITILDGCGFYTKIGIANLIDKCLLTVNEEKKLIMHQLIKGMGRDIIRRESRYEPGKRSRLWCHEDTFTVLKEKTGTEKVKSLTLDLRRLRKDKHGNCSKRRRLGFFSWLPSFSLSNEVGLETKTFMSMKKLKMLQLNYVELVGNFKYFPKNLIWLCWYDFPLKSIPTNFNLEKLVVLDMRHSNLKHLWEGRRFLAELKYINLSHSHGLVRTSDFSGLLSLERLILEDCIKLVEVDESIGNLERLSILNLNGCKKLRKLPRVLKSLEVLLVSGCSKLFEQPEELEKLSSLPKTSWCSTLCSWSWFRPIRTSHSLSFSLAELSQCLVYLNLENCNLRFVTLSSLPSLQALDLSGNPFRSLPKNIKELTKLEILTLWHCKELQMIPELPNCLEIPFGMRIFPAPGLQISRCEKLVEFEGLFKLEPLENADKTVLKTLGLSNLEYLRSIKVDLSNSILTERRTPVQVLHECDVLSIFLPIFLSPGREMPRFSNFQSMGSSISFNVPPFDGHKIYGLNLFTIYGFQRKRKLHFGSGCRAIIIRNKTKSVRWTYSPICFARPEEDTGSDMSWLSHWKIGNQLEVGDRIDVSVHLEYEVKMCGVLTVYESEDEGNQSNTEEIVPNAFPWYQTLTKAGADAHFRCHHSYNFHRVIEEDPQFELDTCFLCEKLERDLTGKSLESVGSNEVDLLTEKNTLRQKRVTKRKTLLQKSVAERVHRDQLVKVEQDLINQHRSLFMNNPNMETQRRSM